MRPAAMPTKVNVPFLAARASAAFIVRTLGCEAVGARGHGLQHLMTQHAAAP